MSIIVCGSVAYDNLMEFEGNFGDYILPDQIHILSVAFTVPNLRKEFGGCAGNIAYKLIQEMGAREAIGPILLGMKKPVHVLQLGSTIREIVNMVAVASVDAQTR